VLTQPQLPDPSDPSLLTNQRILAERLDCPVCDFPYVHDPSDDDALARAAVASGSLGILAKSG
jgi:hypothetical protein